MTICCPKERGPPPNDSDSDEDDDINLKIPKLSEVRSMCVGVISLRNVVVKKL